MHFKLALTVCLLSFKILHGDSDGFDHNAGDLCPDILDLCIHNSLADHDDHGLANAMCRLTVFAPLWVDNRTGFDLHIKDLDVPAPLDGLPFLGKT